jgi:formimidoylglutamate deiminase
MARLTFENLWMDGQWHSDITVELDPSHKFAIVAAAQSTVGAEAEYISGLTLPGLASAHCHAFQRVLAPWTQRSQSDRDSFWTWRNVMYAAASSMEPAELEAVAAKCYLDLLKGGYAAVAEFLYLHRIGGPADIPNADQAIVAAARRVGISLTLLPALYQHSNFGRVPATPAQLPFVRSTPQFLEDWTELKRRYAANPRVTLGIAFHSLRAVDIDTIETVRDAFSGDTVCRAFHIHVAEQPAEVADAVACFGRPPIDVLLDRGLLDPKWTLVHGTHASQAELDGLCDRGATLALCPTTEADLGDGCLKALPGFLHRGGHLSIGSDSNVCCNAYRELRLLEWSQRLSHGRRNVLASPSEPFVADALYRKALAGGRRSLGKRDLPDRGGLPESFVTYGDGAGDWRDQPPENYLSALVFGNGELRAQQVITEEGWLIRDGVHRDEELIEREYRAALSRIRPQLMKTQRLTNRNGDPC